jgi:Mce-associated membrane protein
MTVEADDGDITKIEDRDERGDSVNEVTEVDVEIDEKEGESPDRAARRLRWLARRPHWPARRRLSRVGRALVTGSVAVATLAGLAGWLGYREYDKQRAEAERDLFVQTARQGAVNLTTLRYNEIDADVQRILDSATGAFRDDFQQRSQPFIEVVKAAQSQSEGTVTEAGLESVRRDWARVLVAVSVKSRTAAGEQSPREWRMRIDVQAVGNGAKVSNVVFVP